MKNIEGLPSLTTPLKITIQSPLLSSSLATERSAGNDDWLSFISSVGVEEGVVSNDVRVKEASSSDTTGDFVCSPSCLPVNSLPGGMEGSSPSEENRLND